MNTTETDTALPQMTKAHCEGCENNFYNGNNPYGVKECWSFKSAKLVERIRIGVWQNPPYSKNTVLVPACKHEKGKCLVKPDALDTEGFWKG